MSVISNHAELQELLPGIALELLEPAEAERLKAHLESCAECADLLRGYRDAAAGLALQLPAGPMDSERAAALRARLLTRARSERTISINRKASRMVYQWSGWMVAAGLAGVLLVHHSIHRPFDYGWLAAAVLGVIALALGVYGWFQRSRIAELEAGKREGGDRERR